MQNHTDEMSNLPKIMQEKLTCDYCSEKMKIYSACIIDDGEAVEIWQRCKCGNRFGSKYSGKGYVELFKTAVKKPSKEKEERAVDLQSSCTLEE